LTGLAINIYSPLVLYATTEGCFVFFTKDILLLDTHKYVQSM